MLYIHLFILLNPGTGTENWDPLTLKTKNDWEVQVKRRKERKNQTDEILLQLISWYKLNNTHLWERVYSDVERGVLGGSRGVNSVRIACSIKGVIALAHLNKIKVHWAKWNSGVTIIELAQLL